MENAFKASMYNYITYDNNENLLLYNSYSGIIAKSARDKDTILNLLQNPNNAESKEQNGIFLKLLEFGYIVPEFEDEVAKVDLSHMDKVMGNNLSLGILPTEDCNFRCTYCYESFKEGKMSEDTQQGIISFVQKNISKYGNLAVEWFGGEPLEAVDVIFNLSKAFIDICHKWHKIYSAGVISNGYNLRFNIFKELLKCRVNFFQVTLDGLKESHDKQKALKGGGPTFDVVIDNLRKIRDLSRSCTFIVSVRTNVSAGMYDKMPEYMKFVKEEFGNDERFRFFLRPVGDWGGEAVKHMSGQLIDKNSFDSVYDKVMETGEKVNFNTYHHFLRPGGSMCGAALRNNYLIGTDGRVMKCTMHLDHEMNTIGQITPDGKMTLDNARLAKWVARFSNIRQACKKCFFRPACNASSCPAKGVLSDEDYSCPYEKNSLDNTLKLISQSDAYVNDLDK